MWLNTILSLWNRKSLEIVKNMCHLWSNIHTPSRSWFPLVKFDALLMSLRSIDDMTTNCGHSAKHHWLSSDRSCDTFLPHIFQFLVLLSYECFQPKFNQAKAIVGMPRIIQLCDGIMAGGQPAQTHGIYIFNIYTLNDLGVSNKQSDWPGSLSLANEHFLHPSE